jgi:hypothetical protein
VYLESRIQALKYPVRDAFQAKVRKVEPAAISQARAKVKAYDAERQDKMTIAGKAADLVIESARQAVLFGNSEQALSAIKKLEGHL